MHSAHFLGHFVTLSSPLVQGTVFKGHTAELVIEGWVRRAGILSVLGGTRLSFEVRFIALPTAPLSSDGVCTHILSS